MSAGKAPQRRLGRGLEALLGGTSALTGGVAQGVAPATGDDAARRSEGSVPASESLAEIPVSEIRPNPYQPRREFTLAELNELRDSIKSAGLLQPITVRRSPAGRGYELVAGERRFRAVKDLGWRTVPSIVRDYDDRASLTLALVENLQREDLNPVEEAAGYRRLATEFGLGHGEIADLVGKDRSTVANLLRILQLPAEVQRMLEAGELAVGHARALLGLSSEVAAVKLAREASARGLSVRSVEERVRGDRAAAPPPEQRAPGRPRRGENRPAEIRRLEELLRKRLQTDVAVIPRRNGRGELRINFYSGDDLERLMALIGANE